MRRSLTPLLSLLLLVPAACRDAPPTASAAPTVRDSAGVRIVENGDVEGKAAPFVLAPEPAVRVGWGEDAYHFQFISAGALLADGSAVVVDGRSREMVRFAGDGDRVRVLAGPGKGPGEIGGPRALVALPGDTLLLDDYANRRLSFFHGDTLVRELGMGQGAPNSILLGVRGVTPRGDVLLATSGYAPDRLSSADGPWFQGALVRLSAGAGYADTVATFDFVRVPDPGAKRNIFAPLGMAAAVGGRFVVGRADRGEIRWVGPDGGLEQVARWTLVRQPLTDSVWAAFADAYRADMDRVNNGRMAADAIERNLAEVKEGAEGPLPGYVEILGDPDGDVWLAAFRAQDYGRSPGRYFVVSAEGRWLGAVSVPDRFRILAVRDGRVLGAQLNDVDEQSAVVFPLVPAGPG